VEEEKKLVVGYNGRGGSETYGREKPYEKAAAGVEK